METANEEKVRKINWLDSAIIVFAATVAFVILSFAFNCGYNYYFGVPLMFANTSWFGIAYRLPQMSSAIFLISVVCVFVSFGINLVKLGKKVNKSDALKNVKLILILIDIANIALICLTVYLTIKSKSIVLYVADAMLLSLLVYFGVLTVKQKKIDKALSSMHKDKTTTFINANEQEPAKNSKSSTEEYFERSEQSIKLLNAFPKGKMFMISLVFSLASLLFMIFILYGIITAYNQTTYCFIDENRIVLSTIESNVIILSVKHDTDNNKYMNQYKFQVIPQENLSFYIFECGRIESHENFDDRSWSLRGLKLN